MSQKLTNEILKGMYHVSYLFHFIIFIMFCFRGFKNVETHMATLIFLLISKAEYYKIMKNLNSNYENLFCPDFKHITFPLTITLVE